MNHITPDFLGNNDFNNEGIDPVNNRVDSDHTDDTDLQGVSEEVEQIDDDQDEEDVEVIAEVPEEENESSEEEQADPQTISLSTHIETLKDLGHLLLPEDYEINDDNLEEAYQISERNKLELIKNELINNMPDDLRSIVEYGLEGGSNIQELLEVKAKSAASYNPNNEKDQEKIIRDYMKLKNIDDDIIDNYIDKVKGDETLKTEAKKRLQSLTEYYEEQEKELKQQERERIRQEKQAQEQHYNSVIETIRGEQWDLKTKNEMYSYIYNNEQGMSKALENIWATPKDLVQLARIIKDYYSPDKGFDLEELQKPEKVKEKLVNKIKNKLNTGGSPKYKSTAQGVRDDIDPSQVTIAF